MDLEDLADGHLVARAQAGSLAAFEELVRRHRDRAYRVAYRMLGDRGDAEDATQDALVQAWRALPRFRADAKFSTWIYRIVTNRCLNAQRASRPTDALADVHEAPASRPDELVEAKVRLEQVRLAIADLSAEQRSVLVLREFEGCTYEEIAEVLDLSVSAVKSRLHRARRELMAALRAS